MEILWAVVIVIGAVAWLFIKSSAGPSQSSSRDARTKRLAGTNEEGVRLSDMQEAIDANMPWLQERWRVASGQKEAITADKSEIFPRWYWEPVTERQLDKLSRMGMKGNFRSMSKGQASDAIGIHVEPAKEDAEVLKFFKVKLPHANQTRARAEVAKLMADPLNHSAFEKRPATPMQKAVLEFCGVKVARGLTAGDAESCRSGT